MIKGSEILDVGCGYGRWGALVKTSFHEFGEMSPPMIDGIDAFQPNIDYVSSLGIYREAWCERIPCPLPEKKYSTVIACEILEHLPKESLDATLQSFERAATERVIVSFPNWNYLRGEGGTAFGINPYEAHLCQVGRAHLESKGYKLYGAGFGNRDNLLTRVIGRLLSPKSGLGVSHRYLDSITLRLPWLSETIVAVKDVS